MPASNFRQFSRPLKQEDSFTVLTGRSASGNRVSGSRSSRVTQTATTHPCRSAARRQCTPQQHKQQQQQLPPTPSFLRHYNAWPSGEPVTKLCNLPNDDAYMSQMDSARSEKTTTLHHRTTFTPRLTPPPFSAKALRYTLEGDIADDNNNNNDNSSETCTSRLLCNKSALHDRLITSARSFSGSRFAVQSEEGTSCGQINWVLSPCSKLTIDKKGTTCQQGPFSREFSVTCAAPTNWLRMKWGKSSRCSTPYTVPRDMMSLPSPVNNYRSLRDTPYRC